MGRLLEAAPAGSPGRGAPLGAAPTIDSPMPEENYRSLPVKQYGAFA